MTENTDMSAAEVWEAMSASDFPFALIDPAKHVYVVGNGHYADLLRIDIPELEGLSVLGLYPPQIARSIVSLHGAFARGTLDSTRGQAPVCLPNGEVVEIKGWGRRFEGMTARPLVVTSAVESDRSCMPDDRMWVNLAPHVFGHPVLCETSSRATERRVHLLEGHLLKIAYEVRETGLLAGSEPGEPGAVTTLGGLSPRQREIASRLLAGERVSEIAGAMYLSPSTVRNHLTAIFRKFGVHSQVELISVLKRPST